MFLQEEIEAEFLRSWISRRQLRYALQFKSESLLKQSAPFYCDTQVP
jgi:hypothetical protein